MIELVFCLIGVCLGIAAGVAFMFWLMGNSIRDQFLGRNQANKPIVIDWMDGHSKDVRIMMRGVLVFTGIIWQMTLQHERMSGQRIHMEIVSKAEVMREFRG